MAKKKSQKKINDLIFKELIKRGYSLEGNTRVWNIADSKLWYLTPEQAQGYLDLDSDKSYKEATGQPQGENLIKTCTSDILQQIGDGPLNIVDLGCGDGKKAAIFVEELKKEKPGIKVRYCPIDISGYMVSKAIETFRNLDVDEIIEFQYNISDFENLENITPLLRTGEFKKNVILLIGNTLGNFEVNELLYEVRTAMVSGDLFIVDTGIDDKKNPERAKKYTQNKRLNDWLIHIPSQIGLEKEDVQIGVRFKNSRLEVYYTINEDKEISFQNKKVVFNEGDQIIVVVAYKYDELDLISYLNLYFNNVTVKLSKDKSKIIALCKK